MFTILIAVSTTPFIISLGGLCFTKLTENLRMVKQLKEKFYISVYHTGTKGVLHFSISVGGVRMEGRQCWPFSFLGAVLCSKGHRSFLLGSWPFVTAGA